VREHTLIAQRTLYARARSIVAREYRTELTLERLARMLASSPRQLQRAYAQLGDGAGFRADLRARRLSAAAELLATQPALAVADVARLAGYGSAPALTRAFRVRYRQTPARFRAQPRGRPDQATGAPPDGSPVPVSVSLSSSGSARKASSPGRRSRMSAPPPGAVSAVTTPPC
jgi:AraC family transcriptional regulator of adaptative response / methylphosphotriester-DNA alkyltransferase methyltransferase